MRLDFKEGKLYYKNEEIDCDSIEVKVNAECFPMATWTGKGLRSSGIRYRKEFIVINPGRKIINLFRQCYKDDLHIKIKENEYRVSFIKIGDIKREVHLIEV